MFFTLRNVDPQRKLCQQLSLDVLERVVPLSTIRQALHETGASTPRQRKLNLETILLLVIAMNLYAQESLGAVLQRITTDHHGSPTACAWRGPNPSRACRARAPWSTDVTNWALDPWPLCSAMSVAPLPPKTRRVRSSLVCA